MKLNILRLTSVGEGGVADQGVEALDLIYSILLQEYKCDYYPHILVNHICDADLEEQILKMGKNIIINIRHLTDDFINKSSAEKNEIRLYIIDMALNRLADKEGKLDKVSLEKIRARIKNNNFLFNFIYKEYENKKDQLLGKLIIHPLPDKFCYYFSTEKNGKEISRILIYEGKTSDGYIRDIFNSGKWVNSKAFILRDKGKEFEIHIYVEENRFELINLTQYKNPPYFEVCKAGVLNEEAYKDWLHSLPPEVASILSYKPN